MGAVKPQSVSAATTVTVFQCPCGIGARHRWPRGARPRSRAIFVEAPVSSMNTRSSGSRSGCASNQACRRAATSGRSCSLARAVFFEGEIMAIEKTPDRAGRERGAVLAMEQRGDLDQRDVHLGFDRRQDHVAIRLDVVRPQVAALRQGRRTPLGTPGTHPPDGTRHRMPKRAAAALQDMPSSTTAITRERRSCDNDRAMHAGLLSSMQGESHRAASGKGASSWRVRIVL